MTASENIQRRLEAINVVLQFFNLAETIIRLSLRSYQIVAEDFKVLSEIIDAQAQFFVLSM